MEITRELELQVEPEDGTELLQSHDRTFILLHKQRKWFLEMESTLGGNAVKIIEMTTKNSEYDINLIDKTMSRFKRTDSQTMNTGKMLSSSITCYREMVRERKRQSMWQTSLLSYFKKSPQPPQPSQPPP